MKLLITGDLAIINPFNASTQINHSVKELFASSDLNIINLETAVTESNIKILKTGPNLKAHRESLVDVFKTLNVDVATLANNHLMDYDERGVADTLEFCKEQLVQTVGGGMSLAEASKTLYLDTDEGKIAIVNFAENEWIAATSVTAGFNPLDIIDNARQIQCARVNADYVIIIIHGGHEYYNLPSPRMIKQYRYYAEQGADIVVGHHTHCISGNEVYKGVPIYYSLANFLFNHPSSYEDWYTGLVLEINISQQQLTTVLHPVGQNKNTFDLTLKSGEEKNMVFTRINEFNQIISNDNALDESWKEFISKHSASYLQHWSPIAHIKNKYLKWFLNRLNVDMSNKKTLALYNNLVRCDAHKDLTLDTFAHYFNKRSNKHVK